MKSFFAKVKKKSFSGQKPWTIVHGLIFGSLKKVQRKVCQPEVDNKINVMALVSVA